MYEYDGSPDHPLCHNPVELTEEDIVSMSTLLVNGKYEDCSIVGLSPFCKINPVPEVSISLFSLSFAQLSVLNTDLSSCLYRSILTSGR